MQIRATSYMGMHSASFTSQVETRIRLLSGASNVLNILLVPHWIISGVKINTGHVAR